MTEQELTTRAQLLALGQSSSSISRNFHRILPQIYSHHEPSWFDRCRAVLLWRTDAILSHRTAAWLFGWIREITSVEATVSPSVRLRPPQWLTLYRRDLPPGATTEVQNLPVVSREQTLIDCVAVMDQSDASRLVDERLMAGDGDAVRHQISANPKRKGNGLIRRQIAGAATGFASEPERVLDRSMIVRRLRMRTNFRIGRYVCDFVDELSRTIVEVDGREFHIERDVFRYDRTRQNDLARAGWFILRYAAVDVMADPDRIADEIVATVRRRRAARR